MHGLVFIDLRIHASRHPKALNRLSHNAVIFPFFTLKHEAGSFKDFPGPIV